MRWCLDNFDSNSATGVCFTRSPGTGEKILYGEYLVNAQGEDVVAGYPHTEQDFGNVQRHAFAVYKELEETALRLEKHYKDMQDIEFTIEQGKLFLAANANRKRTAAAAVKVAVWIWLATRSLSNNEASVSRRAGAIEPTAAAQLRSGR